MSLKTKMWLQLLGAIFFAGLAILEAVGLKASSFGPQMGPYILMFGCAVMLFEAWRTWRKMKADTSESLPRHPGESQGPEAKASKD